MIFCGFVASAYATLNKLLEIFEVFFNQSLHT